MNLVPTAVAGCHLVETSAHTDARGALLRTFDREVLGEPGRPFEVVQASSVLTHDLDSLRGMHYQRAPHGERKLVRCTRGAVFDVALDLRPASPTYLRWTGVGLQAGDGRALLIPAGCAHGMQTLAPATELSYLMDAPYVPEAATGVRWNDPAFAIDWPVPAGGRLTMNERDQSYPDFRA